MDDWFVQAGRGYITPIEFDSSEDVTYHVLDDLYFDGKFSCYSRVSIGRFFGQGAVRALCMTFGEGTLVMPKFTELDDQDMLHIPVLAVQDMTKLL